MSLPEIEIIETTETDLEPLYRIIIHNDDVTPMDFVVEVLKQIFFLANDRAADIMLTAHIKGSAYVQSLQRAEAEKRVQRAHQAAGMEGYPLHFSVERE
ncbi:MAG TPA: ATP-dependent Clp protease adaptor ClpS [Anaerolineales bacterium]|nr:ATP-dependent Clp protease adaptor ClpS [Anaerolineales bacterium]HNN12129.1 ATP-dependent Clp protease adaptor ClpS [Anaerolineales bacterium]HNO31911.1 ATP-dependent Clp protease adaptor ClpS [Anaerolineales bacterium]